MKERDDIRKPGEKDKSNPVAKGAGAVVGAAAAVSYTHLTLPTTSRV